MQKEKPKAFLIVDNKSRQLLSELSSHLKEYAHTINFAIPKEHGITDQGLASLPNENYANKIFAAEKVIAHALLESGFLDQTQWDTLTKGLAAVGNQHISFDTKNDGAKKLTRTIRGEEKEYGAPINSERKAKADALAEKIYAYTGMLRDFIDAPQQAGESKISPGEILRKQYLSSIYSARNLAV